MPGVVSGLGSVVLVVPIEHSLAALGLVVSGEATKRGLRRAGEATGRAAHKVGEKLSLGNR